MSLASLLFQVLVIVLFSRLCAGAIGVIRQPRVVGEMIAGLLLGKSVLALVWPTAYQILFPSSESTGLYVLSQFGLILFMFLVGLELDVRSILSRMPSAVLVSSASIVVPLLMGTALSLFLYKEFAPPGIAFPPFALFMGISLSITAFPVLARILKQRELMGTAVGTIALTCAAINDVTAWVVLAVAVGLARSGSGFGALVTFALTAVYAVIMLFGLAPLLKQRLSPEAETEAQSKSRITLLLTLAICSSLATEWIGIHALFGAFMAGAITPRIPALQKQLTERVEDLTETLFIPLFFAYTGLRTEIGLLSSGHDWLVCAVITAVAVAGKLGASTLAVRFTGQHWRDALAVGALMNTRGLVELIVLNIGLDLGILSPSIFTMMVIMALVTTMMTTPLLELFLGNSGRKMFR